MDRTGKNRFPSAGNSVGVRSERLDAEQAEFEAEGARALARANGGSRGSSSRGVGDDRVAGRWQSVRRTLVDRLRIGALALLSLLTWKPAAAQQSDCEVRVAPYFRGTGGFAAKPSNGRSVGITVEGGSSSRAETLFARSDGLVVQLLSQSLCVDAGLVVQLLNPSTTTGSLCSDDAGQPLECRISFTGIEAGGWYWVNGDRNAAVAPLLCEDELGGADALDPGGVTVTRSEHGTATLFLHDAQKLMGIIPHLTPPAGANSCQERVAPIFRGNGGYALKPANGATPAVTFEDGGRTESWNLEVRTEDGLAVGLLSSPLCPGAADRPVSCRVSFTGVEDGGWYWVNGDRNAAVAPLVCAEQLGGTNALDPGGVTVTASTRGTGTLLVHETQNLMAIVPHLTLVPQGADLVVESATVSESSLGPDQGFTLTAEVFNRGRDGAAATTVRWYRSSDSGIDASDTEVGMSSLDALDASARVTASIDLEAPSDTGSYWYGACVETFTGESNTGNNCSIGAQVDVGLSTPASGPDLAILGAEFAPPSPHLPHPGLRFIVRNQGNEASASTVARFYRSADSSLGSEDLIIAADLVVPALAPRGSYRRDSPSNAVRLDGLSRSRPSAPTGTDWIGVCVVAAPGESDTKNNCSAIYLGPDWRVSLSRTAAFAGDSFRLNGRASNGGWVESGATTVRFYWSTDSSLDSSDDAAGTASLPPRGVLFEHDASMTMTAPSSPGTYYYGACVDAVTGELETDNNCALAEFKATDTSVVEFSATKAYFNDDPTRRVVSSSESFTFNYSYDYVGKAIADHGRHILRSSDSTISLDDTKVKTFTGLGRNGNTYLPGRGAATNVTAPDTAGTYYYGMCGDEIEGDADTTDDCTSAITLVVE